MVVSWAMGISPDAELVNTMLDDAMSQLSDEEHPIIHSDRGSHYLWPGWLSRVEKAGLIRSMSRKGCSPDMRHSPHTFYQFHLKEPAHNFRGNP
jgi:putative transposase